MVGAKGGATASPTTPGFAAEFGGGWFDFWGGSGSYPCMAQREGPGYERVFYGTNIANRLTIENFYMTVGGTSWGWLPAPVVYTSYDYGAAFDEGRHPRAKASTMKVRASGGAYRVLVFVNGWNMGQYVASVGPQHVFAVPSGILDPHGSNTLALAVTGNGGAGDALERVALVDLGTVRGGVPLTLVQSPGF